MNKEAARAKVRAVNDLAKAARKIDQEELKEEIARYRACFWTWRWGHVWLAEDLEHDQRGYVCQSCGKVGSTWTTYRDGGVDLA